MEIINWSDFVKVEIRIGRITEVESFPEAIKPAYKLKVDFGNIIGVKKSSAQITDLYTAEELLNKLVVAVVNFSPKQIGPFMSECLITGFENEQGQIVLAVPDKNLSVGAKLV